MYAGSCQGEATVNSDTSCQEINWWVRLESTWGWPCTPSYVQDSGSLSDHPCRVLYIKLYLILI